MKTLIATLAMAVSSVAFSAGIGDNYAAGGYALGGYASIVGDNDVTTITVAPNVEFFLQDGLAVSGGAYYRYTSFNSASSSLLSISGGARYVLSYDPAASEGLVHSVGVNASSVIAQTGGGSFNLSAEPYYRADYFLTPYVSVYGAFMPAKIVLADGVDFLDPKFDVKGGVSVHIPNRLKDWSKILK